MSRNVVILLFDDVDVLDFAGPFEVFSVAGREKEPKPFKVVTVSEYLRPVVARGGLSINPTFTYENCPLPDLLVVPGGWGTRPQLKNPGTIDFVRRMARPAELVLSVCTGALLLGAAGLLDDLPATTHHERYDLLAQVAPRANVVREQRVVDAGRIITSGGISSGIDMAFHVVERLLGAEEADSTAAYMEYRRTRSAPSAF